ncbi:MAG TPA: SIS domain-containing protein [Acidimicrobiales bacterium]
MPLDTIDMFGAAAGLADQMASAAVALAGGVAGLPERSAVTAVVVQGMGGSGIAGDVLHAVAAAECPVPIVVNKDYELPGFVDEGTLFFAVTCSGNTEETLEAAAAACQAGARLVAVSQGGALAELAGTQGAPHVLVPADISMPRAGIGALAVPLLLVLEQVGLLPGANAMIDDAVAQLRVRGAELRPDDGPAALLARRIGGTFPLVYGGGALGAVAAARWKGQFNENAKAPAWANRLPEACHNEAAGWGQHGDVTRQVLTLVRLRHDFEHPQLDRRYALLDDLMSEVVGSVHDVVAQGEGPLAQLFDLVLYGDFVSLHAAAQAGVDPGPIPALDYIKAGLAG